MTALVFCFALSDAFVIQDHTLEIECPAPHCDISGMFPVPNSLHRSVGTHPESSMLAILGSFGTDPKWFCFCHTLSVFADILPKVHETVTASVCGLGCGELRVQC